MARMVSGASIGLQRARWGGGGEATAVGGGGSRMRGGEVMARMVSGESVGLQKRGQATAAGM